MSTEKVIPTSWLIAHCRMFTDIPFSKEIFAELEKVRVEKKQDIPDVIKDTRLAPQFEARYKLVNRLVKEIGIKQILEIAVGFTPRGMDMSTDASITYIESDFEELIKEKEKMAIKFLGQKPNNLFFESADALDLQELKDACKHFNPNEPIVVINEGLLRYLSFEQKKIVAENVAALLEKYGGVWITPDISKKRIVQNQEIVGNGMRDKISEITGINIDNNLFNDEAHAHQFFSDLGYDIERHSFAEEIDNLISPDALNIGEDKVHMMLDNAQVFVMRKKF